MLSHLKRHSRVICYLIPILAQFTNGELADSRDFIIEPNLNNCNGCHVVIEEKREAFHIVESTVSTRLLRCNLHLPGPTMSMIFVWFIIGFLCWSSTFIYFTTQISEKYSTVGRTMFWLLIMICEIFDQIAPENPILLKRSKLVKRIIWMPSYT